MCRHAWFMLCWNLTERLPARYVSILPTELPPTPACTATHVLSINFETDSTGSTIGYKT